MERRELRIGVQEKRARGGRKVLAQRESGEEGDHKREGEEPKNRSLHFKLSRRQSVLV